jgi:hypothetical protein
MFCLEKLIVIFKFLFKITAMNKLFLLITTLSFLVACNSGVNKAKNKHTQDTMDSLRVKQVLLVPDYMKGHVSANHEKLIGVKGNIESYKQYLKTLDTSLLSITYALDYVKTCFPQKDTIQGDSAFKYFNNEFHTIIQKLADSIVSQYGTLIQMIDSSHSTDFITVGAMEAAISTPSSKLQEITFLNNLNSCGVYLMNNALEGDQIEDQPDFLYYNFRNRVSTDVKKYLKNVSDEDKEGYSEDGGLMISFEDVYKRAKFWEKFMTDYPHSLCLENAQLKYESYINDLLTGEDNSPTFDIETNILDPKIKALYRKIIMDEPESTTSKIILSWFNLIARHGFTRNDTVINTFVKENKLESMYGVETGLK